MSSACYEDRSQLLGRDPDLWDDGDQYEDLFDYQNDSEDLQDDPCSPACGAFGCAECLGYPW